MSRLASMNTLFGKRLFHSAMGSLVLSCLSRVTFGLCVLVIAMQCGCGSLAQSLAQSSSAMNSSASSIPVLSGITALRITTPRLTTRVLFSGDERGVPVMFLHGNLTSATWWEETMLALPAGFRGIAPDLRGFGEADTAAVIDATRGMGDLADDVLALMDKLGIRAAHLVGNSMGGNVIWRLLADAPERILSVTLSAPGSPFGFGGTKDVAGTPCYPDYAGTGAGLANAALLKAIAAGDRSLANPFTPRSAMRALIFKPPFIAAREEELLSAMLQVHRGERAMPGDAVSSPNWTGFAPGKWGIVNAISGKYANGAQIAARLAAFSSKPPVLWIRGADDLVVSNTAASDVGTLGLRGLIPNYPGKEVFPPQPMLDQIRAVLDRYKKAGGHAEERVLENCGHAPHIEQPALFNQYFHALLRTSR